MRPPTLQPRWLALFGVSVLAWIFLATFSHHRSAATGVGIGPLNLTLGHRNGCFALETKRRYATEFVSLFQPKHGFFHTLAEPKEKPFAWSLFRTPAHHAIQIVKSPTVHAFILPFWLLPASVLLAWGATAARLRWRPENSLPPAREELAEE